MRLLASDLRMASGLLYGNYNEPPCFPSLSIPPFRSVLFATVSAENHGVSASAVIQEMNLARQNPGAYAAHLEELRSQFNGRFLVLPGKTKIYTREGLGAVDEAIRFLRSAQPLQPLTLSPGMSRGAADHCASQAGGAIGHGAMGNPASRMNRYGNWGAARGGKHRLRQDNRARHRHGLDHR